jgi:tetratricopeptide (TPR) repeat protein
MNTNNSLEQNLPLLEALQLDREIFKSIKSSAKRARYRSAFNWLTIYKIHKSEAEQQASDLEKVKGYFEAFKDFCKLEEWLKANIILTWKPDLQSDEVLGKQIGVWGYYSLQIELYSQIHKNLDEYHDAEGLTICGSANRFLNAFENAQQCFDNALNIYSKLKNEEQCAKLWHELGLLKADQGDDEQAFSCYKKSLKNYKKIKNYKGIVSVLNDISRIATNRNKYRQSLLFIKRIKSIYDNYLDHEKNQENYAWTLYNIGRLYADQNENLESEKYIKQSLIIFDNKKSKTGIAYSYYSLGILMLNFQNNQSAYEYCQKSLKLFKQLNNSSGIASARHILGRVAFRIPDVELAKECYQEVLKIRNITTGKLTRIATALEGFARLAEIQNQPYRSVLLFSAANALREKERRFLPLADLPEYEESRTSVLNQIGKDAFKETWNKGSKMSVDQAIILALNDTFD